MASAKEQQQAMNACAMIPEQWKAAKAQVKRIKARGRRQPQTSKSLEDWGAVDGQIGLFE